MDKFLISIIMPTYNRGYIIKEAIESVINQTISNWELIIIDDASSDNTEKIVKEFVDSRIIFSKNDKNRGANYSRNRGCSIARGQFLAFLDSDNVWENRKLEKQVKVLLSSEETVAMTFCQIKKIDEKKNTVIAPDLEFDINNLQTQLRTKSLIDMNTVLLKSDIFRKVGAFDNDMPRLQDWDLFFRIIVVYQYKAIYIPEILGYTRIQPNSISSDFHKYLQAIVLFLKKYSMYLEAEEILPQFCFTLKNIKNRTEALAYINEFIDSVDCGYKELFSILSQQFYRQVQNSQLLYLWKMNLEKGEERTIFISDYDWNDLTIALYGLGQWGELIYAEMKNLGYKIQYGIDKKVKKFYDLHIIDIQKIPDSVNLIIVSVIQEYEEICADISQHYSGRILSIEELISNVEFM